jgi:hypothetical protein
MNRNGDIPKVSELLKNGGRCSICGYVYNKNAVRWYEPNNGVAHRYFHRQHAPAPEPLVAGFPEGDIKVDSSSPAWLHKLVYERAHYLARQEHYDFTQWNDEHGLRDNEFEKDSHALLLIEPPHVPIGAVSFAWKKWSDRAHGWHINFIWVAGTWRRKGMISRRWPLWLETYGAFTIETPWSKNMKAFLATTGVPDLEQARRAREAAYLP